MEIINVSVILSGSCVLRWDNIEPKSLIERKHCYESLNLAGERWRALPEPVQPSDETEDVYSSVHKDYCRLARGPGLHAPPCPGSQREARPGQSMPGSEEPEESKSCQRCIIDEAERKGRGEEERKREYGWSYKTRHQQSRSEKKNNVQIEVLILIWSGIKHFNNRNYSIRWDPERASHMCIGITAAINQLVMSCQLFW